MNKSEHKENSLSSRVITGGKWMILLRILGKGTSVITSLILARLLTPEDFGLVAVGLIIVSLLKSFSDVGIKQALIVESQKNTDDFLDTAWSVEIIRGALIFIVVYFTAELITDFFNEPEAVNFVRVLGLGPLITSLASIRIIYLQKELEFKKQFIFEITNPVISFVISIILAFTLQNAWAIVLGNLCAAFGQSLISYYLMPFLPKFKFNFSYFRKMFSFGKWILLSSFLSYFAMELDTYIAAKAFDARLLGIYTLAFTIATKPTIEIGKALGKVLFPAFAKMAKDKLRLKKSFFKASSLLYMIIVSISITLHFISESFVQSVLDPGWIEMILPLKILSLAALFNGLRIISSGLFNGISKPNLVFIQAFVRLILLIISLLILTNFYQLTLGIIAYSVLASNFFTALYYFYLVKKELFILSYKEFIKNYYPIIMHVIMLVPILLILDQSFNSSLLNLAVTILTSVTLFIYNIYLFRRKYSIEMILEKIK